MKNLTDLAKHCFHGIFACTILLAAAQAFAEKQEGDHNAVTKDAMATKTEAKDKKVKQTTSTMMATEKTQKADISTAAGLHKGAKDGAVTLVKFGDFYCGKCKALSTTISELLEDKKYKGKVSFFYMLYPASGDKATKIAMESLCAKEQNKFWEFHDAAFAAHGSLNEKTGAEIAKKLSLDTKAFEACSAAEKTKKMVATSKAEGDKLGITATPALFVGGSQVTELSKAGLMAAFDAVLAQKKAQKKAKKKTQK